MRWPMRCIAETIRLRPEIVSPAMMQGLFPEGAHAELWPCAVELARERHTREAISLGNRVLDERTSQRPVVGREVARWHLALGDVDAARSVLASVCEGTGESLACSVILSRVSLAALSAAICSAVS